MMPMVTGMGCTATALCGAFAAVMENHFWSAVSAMVVMSAAGSIAGEECPGPGTFQVRFIDALYNFTEKDLERVTLAEE